ncbi:MAG: hypothetical protein ACFFD8_08860 [Candidatus Thorarchaeota archaeon]
MTPQDFTLQSSSEKILPHSLWTALLALFVALGIVFRQIAIPTFSPFVTLTPGFIIPLLTGIVLGPLGGILCGIFVGLSGGLWEPVLIPLIGNIALGLSTGIPTYFRHKMRPYLWIGCCIISAIIIGGFLPTFSIEVLFFWVVPPIAAISASVDALQASMWVITAFIVTSIIDPFLLGYRRKK